MVVGLVLAVAGAARAQPAEPDPTIGHDTVNLQRFDGSSRAGIDGTWIDMGGDRWLLRLDLHGQYVEPRTGLGGYVQLPYTRLHQVSDPFNNQAGTLQAFGHLELGALWALPATSRSVALVFHGGVAIAIDKDENSLDFVSVGALLKPHELYATWPDLTSARSGASLLLRSAPVFARFDAGIDVNVTTSNFLSSHMPGIHANAAVGVRSADTLSLALELSTLTILVDEPLSFLAASTGFSRTDMLASFAFSVRYRRDALELYGALLGPLRDRQRRYIDGGITMGVEYAIP